MADVGGPASPTNVAPDRALRKAAGSRFRPGLRAGFQDLLDPVGEIGLQTTRRHADHRIAGTAAHIEARPDDPKSKSCLVRTDR